MEDSPSVSAPCWWHNEDWLAVLVGGLLIAAVLLGWRPALPTFSWMTTAHITKEVNALLDRRAMLEHLQQECSGRGETEIAAALAELKAALIAAEIPAVRVAVKNVETAVAQLKTPDSGKTVLKFIAPLQSKRTAALGLVFNGSNLKRGAGLGVLYLLISLAGVRLLGGKPLEFLLGFPLVFVLAWLALWAAGNARANDLGLEYVIFALILGLVINHVFPLPGWLRQAVRTEFYIKSGLVILGAGILFQEIMQAGLLGVTQSVLVVTVVWYFCFWFARRLQVDDEFAVMLSTAVSICGVSAAIAACGAIQGDRKKLSYVTSIVLIVAVPMMILMPWTVKHFHMPEIVAGAWMGGTLDTSGSVVAAGAMISEPAMKTGVIVKFSQNVLIGVAAFGLSIWWTMRQRKTEGQRPSASLIWERFPKFVLGFIVASMVFSFALDPALVKETKGLLTGLRNFWFALAFVSIGLETKFTDLISLEGGRPACAFIGAQAFNVFWTLILAWLLFGGVLFAVPNIN